MLAQLTALNHIETSLHIPSCMACIMVLESIYCSLPSIYFKFRAENKKL